MSPDSSKTGLMVKDTGRRDSAGLEDIDAFFSPAGKEGRGMYRTKLHAAMHAPDDMVSMQGTSSNTCSSGLC
jgi:Kinetochore CENP-C fungal homologue, Mif2, N-terminal